MTTFGQKSRRDELRNDDATIMTSLTCTNWNSLTIFWRQSSSPLISRLVSCSLSSLGSSLGSHSLSSLGSRSLSSEVAFYELIGEITMRKKLGTGLQFSKVDVSRLVSPRVSSLLASRLSAFRCRLAQQRAVTFLQNFSHKKIFSKFSQSTQAFPA